MTLKPNRRKNEAPYYLAEDGREFFGPTSTQLRGAVHGDDRYQPKRFPWWALFLIAAGAYGLVHLFTKGF